ncbi:gamma-mobile-trio recombinase GmtY [Neobacillus cucumis]|uniref:gamma-mobile-trio recombinase GmtY n=1 Tax=Neobacillus cucumis TaxID=1740721 RepID=UPI002E1F9808|nr:gamma-mobile-trio recombinase GmtY [Neobacillus cucumis]
MRHVKVISKTVRDNTGISKDMPTILIEQNGEVTPLWQLHEYLLKNQYMSDSWRNKLIQAVGLLLDYMDANQNSFSDPKEFFDSFADVIYSGTINEEGYDPSGLYWLPKSTKTANALLSKLNGFSDWLHKEYGALQLNPWRNATKYEERLNWAALINKSHRSFLGHLDSALKMSATAKRARNIMQKRTPSGDYGDVPAFPEDKIYDLLFEGFKKPDKKNKLSLHDKYNWRNIAITILMHGGGLRECEPFHIWVNDVIPDPFDPKLAVVRVYHPSQGSAPKDFKMLDGKHLTNREAYLRIKYSLVPRNKLVGLRHAGWKNPKMSDTKKNFMQVHWFPRQWGYLFMQVWKMYLAQRIHEKILDTHPFLFVSFDDKNKGEMYTISSFRQSHTRAVQKIGLTVGKMQGTTEHGHRHAYGQRLSDAKLDPKVNQEAFHHNSIESQEVYTKPTIERITRALAEANEALDNGEKLPMNVDLDAWFNQERKIQKQWIQGGKNKNGR